ncbi:MAG TPA: hypothetical protein HA349_06800 [Methanotrichaceae archaeon]|nr:hypothetical protein [Methanotrichaceae archaeon]
MIRLGNVFLVSTLIAITVLSAVMPVSAITATGSFISDTVYPGESVSYKIGLITSSTEPASNLSATIVWADQSLEGGLKAAEEDSEDSPYSAADFLSLSTDTLRTVPGEEVKLLVEGTIPDDDGPAGRYAAVTIAGESAKIGETSGGSKVGVSVGFLVPVYLTISGKELIQTGEITDTELSEYTGPDEPITVSTTFKNTGNHHYRAVGVSIIKDQDENVVATASTRATARSIIPRYSMLFKMSFESGLVLEPGTYTVDMAVAMSDDGTVLDTETTELVVV